MNGATSHAFSHPAGKNPGKLDELKQLFIAEAARCNVFPLDDRRSEPMNADMAGWPNLLNGRTAITFYPGMGQLPENTVPNVKNRSHTVTADVEVPEKANGVMVAQAAVSAAGRCTSRTACSSTSTTTWGSKSTRSSRRRRCRRAG